MKMWEFENYTVYEEMDLLRFENLENDLLGYVMKDKDNQVIKDLDNGVNPINEGWEDGVGNTISIEGWGNYK